MIGIRPGRGPCGSCTRSCAAWKVPSKSARPSRSSGTMIWSASSKRPKTLSSGSPNACACLARRGPHPSPRTNRPPLISSSVSTAFAVMPALRWSADRTHVPTLIRDVTAATAPAIATPSQNPVGGLSSGSHSSSSAVQTVSNPSASARSAISRSSLHRGERPLRPPLARVQHDPDLEPAHRMPPRSNRPASKSRRQRGRWPRSVTNSRSGPSDATATSATKLAAAPKASRSRRR